jgi:hypothetical protein
MQYLRYCLMHATGCYDAVIVGGGFAAERIGTVVLFHSERRGNAAPTEDDPAGAVTAASRIPLSEHTFA